jgi:rRNA maturation RNase YbeY
MNNIEFHFEDIVIPDFNPEFLRLWISAIVDDHNKEYGDLNYIFCSNEYILKVNKEHLNHDYFTDIITFNYNEGNTVNGDVFISYETIIENAIEFSDGIVKDELERVVIHGVLHLIGFNDKTDDDQNEMTRQEDIALLKRKEIEN